MRLPIRLPATGDVLLPAASGTGAEPLMYRQGGTQTAVLMAPTAL